MKGLFAKGDEKGLIRSSGFTVRERVFVSDDFDEVAHAH